MARYDGIADWYDTDFLSEVPVPEHVAAIRLLGRGPGRLARGRGLEVVRADVAALPFDDASFDAVVSLWTHTDVGDFRAAVGEVARVLRPGSPFVYGGAHPCFVGPHSRFIRAEDVPELYSGYLDEGRDGLEAVGVGSEEGLRAKVGAVHLTLGNFVVLRCRR